MTMPISEVDVSQLPAELPTDLHVLDVREDDEWRAGHIEGAAHIPMMDVPARLTEIPADSEVLVVCRSGARSAQVTGFLSAQGRNAVNLAGGMQAWASAGRSMVSGSGAEPAVQSGVQSGIQPRVI